jgi:hypothetical protein
VELESAIRARRGTASGTIGPIHLARHQRAYCELPLPA